MFFSTDLNNYLGFFAYDSSYNQIVGTWANPYFKTSNGDPNYWKFHNGYVVSSTTPAGE